LIAAQRTERAEQGGFEMYVGGARTVPIGQTLFDRSSPGELLPLAQAITASLPASEKKNRNRARIGFWCRT
jgi:hypothetical protein